LGRISKKVEVSMTVKYKLDVVHNYVTREDEMEAAMCLWEAFLANPKYEQYRKVNGTANARLDVMALAKDCHLAWEVSGETGAFDWDFVPEWLEENFDV
jgi:hypothetical protein